METIKINDFEILIQERGVVTLKEKDNEIFLGNFQGNRFKILFQSLKVAQELGYLKELTKDKKQLDDKMVKLSKIIEECKEDKIFHFPFRLYGTAFAMTDKKPTRVSISLPEDICGKSLSDLDKWAFVIIAVDKKEWDRVWNKIEKGGQNKR